ncbi:MAG: hypothetical protein ACE5GN_03410 [Waddliaceae bacterium]
MTKKVTSFLFLISAIFLLNNPLSSADASELAGKLKLKRTFTQSYDLVWDATVAVFKEKGLGTHPHKKKMSAKKKKGKIKTPIFRYFKIWDASPVVSKQYRDSYIVKVKKVEVEKPKPAEAEAPKEGQADTPDAVLKPGDTAADAPQPAAETPPVEIETVVTVDIKRKFQIHNDEKREWEAGDPIAHPVGYTAEYLMNEIEAKLASAGTPSEKVEPINLIITPPLIVQQR